jgi:hypothetical protein
MEQCSRIWDEEYCATAMEPLRFHPLIALALHLSAVESESDPKLLGVVDKTPLLDAYFRINR